MYFCLACHVYLNTVVYENIRMLIATVCEYEVIWNFINIIKRHSCHDYVGQVWNESINVHRKFRRHYKNITFKQPIIL